MSTLNRIVMGVSVVAATLVLGGCAASPDEAEDARLNQVDTPLPHDPTDKFEIGPWWSDGRHLLNLRADGGYSLFDNNNRYARPTQRGRWGQQSYGTMWLEPYSGYQPQRIRVAITRVDGRLALQVPKMQSMFELPAPPATGEDAIFGQWQGTMGSLALNSNMTYTFAPAPGATSADGRVLAGHNGKWSLANETLTLQPATPSVATLTLKVRPAPPAPAPEGAAGTNPAAAADPTLEGLGGELVKVNAAQA